jgi:rhodanese-related sulfurtransferase
MINKKNIFILIIGLVLTGAGYNLYKQNNPAVPNNTVQETTPDLAQKLSPAAFKEIVAQENTFTIDVHTPEQKHLPGTDAVISYDKLEENIDELPQDKDTPIAVYCRSGSMSEIAGQTLKELGYTNVVDLAGGINKYKSELDGEVSITPLTKDLGEVIYGEVATTQFEFTNFTDQELKVTRVSTSCGCTKANIAKDVLAPYESTTIDVSFDPAVHKDDTDVGELTRTIYIETNHQSYPKLESTITANVIKK